MATFGGEGSAEGQWEGVGGHARPVSESQLSDLRNMRVLLEEARALARDLAYHRRARLEAALGPASDEVERQIEDLRESGAEDRTG